MEKPISKKNTAVYISGLPLDVTISEVQDHFEKVGVIMDDMFTGGPRIKLYEDDNGELKGDGLVVFLRKESVELAVKILDESQLRPGVYIRVQEASFNESEHSEPLTVDSTAKVDKRTWKKFMQSMNKKLSWNEFEEEEDEEIESADSKLLKKKLNRQAKILVLKHMYTRKDIESEPTFILDLKEDIIQECEKFGTVTSVKVLDHLDEFFEENENSCAGIVCIKFTDKNSVLEALPIMDGRYFAGNRITALKYDGSFKIKEKREKEDDKDVEQRLEEFADWLEEEPSE